MKFEEYLETLPKNLLSGEDVQLPEKSFREIFKFSNLGKDDIFFHLGCNNEKGIEIAIFRSSPCSFASIKHLCK